MVNWVNYVYTKTHDVGHFFNEDHMMCGSIDQV